MNPDRLLFYENIRKDDTIRTAVKLAESAGNRRDQSANYAGRDAVEEEVAAYYEVQRDMIEKVTVGDTDGTFWENYVYRLVAESENKFSLGAENGSLDDLTRKLACSDIDFIKDLAGIDWEAISESLKSSGALDKGAPCVCAMRPHVNEDGRASIIKKALSCDFTARESVEKLETYYNENYCGILGKYRAFIWDGSLKGVKSHDPITFSDLIGYDIQQQQLIRNTEVFVNGGKANNVLLYGDKGTGKSSSVKALLNYFGDRGLRMINVPKSRISDIMKIMEKVSARGCSFIIFIDDLSFESTEIEYKHFKSVLEGGLEVQSANVLVYVTSNRRNLVKETWADRNDSDGEIFASDGIQERQSLADRFGLTLTFYAPDKELFEEIIKSLAEKEGIKIDEQKLLAEAKKWDARQTGRSGRSAKQFITYISGIYSDSAAKSESFE